MTVKALKKKNNMARTTGRSGFKLRSGNSAPFKQLGITGANPIKPKAQSKTGNIFSDRPGYKEKAAASREKFGKTVVGKTLKSFGDFLRKGKKTRSTSSVTPNLDNTVVSTDKKINVQKPQNLTKDLVKNIEKKNQLVKKSTKRDKSTSKVKKTGTTSYADYAKGGGDVDAAKKWNMKTYGTHSPTARAKKLGISKSELSKQYKDSLKKKKAAKKKVEKNIVRKDLRVPGKGDIITQGQENKNKGTLKKTPPKDVNLRRTKATDLFMGPKW